MSHDERARDHSNAAGNAPPAAKLGAYTPKVGGSTLSERLESGDGADRGPIPRTAASVAGREAGLPPRHGAVQHMFGRPDTSPVQRKPRDENGAAPARGAPVSGGAAAGTVQRETDPRLHWVKGDSEGMGLDAKILPFDKPNEPGVGGWNAQEILSRLTQIDEDAATFTDDVRCGANVVLAIAINNGPEAVQDLITKVMKRGSEIFERKMKEFATKPAAQPTKDSDAPGQRAQDALAGSLQMLEPSLNITYRKATYHDLSMIAHCIKLVMSAKPRGATTGHEVLDAQSMIGETIEGAIPGELGKGGTIVRDEAHLRDLVKKLAPGDAFTLNVDSDKLDPERGKHQPISLKNEVNHFVTLGRERKPAAGADRARLFLYDPYPREGMSQYVYSDNEQFLYFFKDENGVWKSVQLVAQTKAPA